MPTSEDVRARVERCLRVFLDTSGRQQAAIDDATDLVRGLEINSDEGLDLVLDLCEEFAIDFPRSFNPVVHDSGRRGRRFGELVQYVETLIRQKEGKHGSR